MATAVEAVIGAMWLDSGGDWKIIADILLKLEMRRRKIKQGGTPDSLPHTLRRLKSIVFSEARHDYHSQSGRLWLNT